MVLMRGNNNYGWPLNEVIPIMDVPLMRGNNNYGWPLNGK